MKVLSIISIILLVAIQYNISNSQNKIEKFVYIKGHDLQTPDGKKLFLKGINLGNWLNPEGYMFMMERTSSARLIDEAFRQMVGPEFTDYFWQEFKKNYINEEDIKFIKSSGANSIRVPFHYKLFTDEDYMGLSSKQDGFAIFDNLVKWCKKYNLFIILDMHDAPCGQTGDNIDDSYGYPWLMTEKKCQETFINIWTEIAKKYSNETIILGYDLLNEPIATYFDKDKEILNKNLEPLYIRAAKSIRKYDRNHIILLGGAQWNSNFQIFKKGKFDDKMMFTCHRYWCDTTQANIQDFVNFRDSINLPLYMGETGENTDEWISAWTKLMDKNNIGYHYWPYKKMSLPSCMTSIKVPEEWDMIVKFAEGKRDNYGDIRANRPDQEKAKKIMMQLLENIKFKNCTKNPGYIKAIGL